jgi:formylglycine-generating enzyme required for sulfatase activity/serine/threonine protein kinase
MNSGFQLLLERLERSGFTKEAQLLTTSHFTKNSFSPQTEQRDMPGKLGAFEILGELGEGGYGFVYLGAQQTPVKRTAAIKMLKKGMDSQAVLTRFRGEQQAMALMDHPNVATIFESGTSPDGRPWFAMPLVAGIPIDAHCDLEMISIQARVKLFMDACHGVIHAHQRGILHRDLKPANILINFEDHQAIPKVIDFGIAKAVEGADPLSSLTTQAATPLGTPAYMSPEQFGGHSDARSDIWALGIILGELLCGVRPVRRDPVREIDGRISEPQPERPSLRYARLIHDDPEAAMEVAQQRGVTTKILQAQLRGDLDAIVLKCLEIDRDRRYRRVSELLDDLARYINGKVVEARPPSLLYQTQRFVVRQRLQVVTGIIVVSVVAAATAMSIRSATRAVVAPQIAFDPWCTVLEQTPNAAVVTDSTVRAQIVATGFPWRVQDNSSGIEMVLIPAGTFIMGCSASNSEACNAHENPTHQVTLTQPFYLGKTEVTQAQWQAKLGINPSYFRGNSNNPVEQVSWNEIAGFNTATGLRLPTEAEWEYACRGGTIAAFHSMHCYPNGTNDDSLLGNIAWDSSNSGDTTHVVGEKATNMFGLHDMSGNVREWCSDSFGSTYYSTSPSINPIGPTEGAYRVLRGGSYRRAAVEARSSYRSYNHPYTSYKDDGFRVARTPAASDFPDTNSDNNVNIGNPSRAD